MENSKLYYRIATSMVDGLGPTEARVLITACEGDLTAIFHDNDLYRNLELSDKLVDKLHDKTVFERTEKELDFIEKHKIEALWFEDENYPRRLKECPDSPLILYKKGVADLDASKVLAIVGTRKMTAYGRNQTEELVKALAEKVPGLLIVSGLALGADVCAHRAAMANGLVTVGVLGNGLSQLYPPANRDTARQMLETGALLTELPHNTPIEGFRFLQRNRIIAGLSDACVVIESAFRGGSMSTARLARDYNREVLAIPGRNIDHYSQGCNQLIEKNIASILTCPDDILKLMNWDMHDKKESAEQGSLFSKHDFESLPEPLKTVAELFEPGEEYTPGQLLHLCNNNLSMADIISTLLQLELLSIVTHLPANRYRLS